MQNDVYVFFIILKVSHSNKENNLTTKSLPLFCFPLLHKVRIEKHRNQVKRLISPNPANMPKMPVLPGFFDCFILYVFLCLCVNTLSFGLFAAKIQG